MSNEIDKAYVVAWRNLLKAHAKLVGEIDRDLVSSGCEPIECYDVLITLDNAPDKRLRMHELSEAALLSRSGMTRLIDRLEAKGYVSRHVCPLDRRGSNAGLTEAGKKALDASWPVYEAALSKRFVQFVGKKDANDLAKTLKRIVNEKPAK